ncbi:MAG: beta-ketoacyl synthase N-terminal-like domain-containing protein [Cyanobacteria bacterium P01_D01_bin.73]
MWSDDPIVITGLGVTTALGDRDQSWRRLLAGESALQLRQPFQELPPYPLAMIGDRPANLEDLTITTARETLRDAGMLADSSADVQKSKLQDIGLVVGSSRGFQGRLEQECDRHYSQAADKGTSADANLWFQRALPQEVAIAVAREFGIQGPLSAPMSACATGLWSIMQGVLMLRAGQCRQVLVVAADSPITPLCIAGFSRMGAIAPDGMYPFDIERQGLSLGEGAAGFMLETQRHAADRSAEIYGEILGLGLTADGTHITAPDETLTGVDRAIDRCLRSGQFKHSNARENQDLTAAIGYVHAHGTATQRNDRQEAAILQRWFPQGIPISSTKGATGHTLGASGALGIAWSLLALKNQALPPVYWIAAPCF